MGVTSTLLLFDDAQVKYMHSLRENPYRLLGVLASSSSKEIDSRSKKLRQYLAAEVEPTVSPDYYCPTLGRKPMRRIIETIDQAKAKLTLDQDKLLFALLWFVEMNPVTDPVALDALAQGNFAEAERIWRQQVFYSSGEKKPINDKNCSAYHNLSVYFLCSTNIQNITTGVGLALEALEHQGLLSFLQSRLGLNTMPSVTEVEKVYLEQLIADIQKRPRGGLSHLMEMLAKLDYSAKPALMKGFAFDLVSQLERSIERNVKASEESMGVGLQKGQALLADGGKTLKQIELSLSKGDLKYQRVSDALAKGIKCCGEEYFEDCSDDDGFDAQALLSLYRSAVDIACSDFLVKEMNKKVQDLQEWIKDAPQRREEAKVKSYVSALMEQSEQMLRHLPNTLPNLSAYVDSCEKSLEQIKATLGTSSAVYTKYSTMVGRIALGSLVTIVNRAQEKVVESGMFVALLRDTLNSAWILTTRIEALGLESDFRNGHFKKNKDVLRSLCGELGINTSTTTTTTNKGDDDNWGCWIVVAIAIFIALMNMCSN